MSCDTRKSTVPTGGMASVQANSHNEDRARIATRNGLTIATVADGHGSHVVSQFVVERLPEELFKRISRSSWQPSITAAFVHVDNLLRDIMFTSTSESSWNAGSCAIAAIVDDLSVTVANCGHSRALLIEKAGQSNCSSKFVSDSHSADNEGEQARLRSLHPDERDVVHCKHKIVELDADGNHIKSVRWAACYVKGRLQATRSFGDFYLKDIRASEVCPNLVPDGAVFTPPYIEAVPSLVSFERQKDSVLVLASDGLWDYLSQEEVTSVVDALRSRPGLIASESDIAEALIEKALAVAADATNGELSLTELKDMKPGTDKRNIHDDITAVVLFL